MATSKKPQSNMEYRQRVQPVTTSYQTPSSSNSTISLALSSSNLASHSSSSPPQLKTPPQRTGRLSSRYPDLGRVPLHRRGTSQTYERLEDLLREAGYKETRVFTPEAERIEHAERKRREGSPQRRSLRGVVGFFAGLMPGGTSVPPSSLRPDTTDVPPRPNVERRRTYSPPSSPVQHRLAQKQRQRSPSTMPSTPGSTSSMECAGPTPKASYQSPRQISRNTEYMQQPSSRFYAFTNNPSSTSLHSQRLPNSPAMSRRNPNAPSHLPSSTQYAPSNRLSHKPSEPIMQPQPSRAGAYLRHMASVANLPQRPRSTPPANLKEVKEEAAPPLPHTWLETVARAVMYGGIGYIGGPKEEPPPSPSRGRLPPPIFMTQMSKRRSRRSVGEVSRTRVSCHSAPSSRATSRTRDGEREEKIPNPRERGRKKKGNANLPTLARTRVEGEPTEWAIATAPPKLAVNGHRYLRSWGIDPETDHDESSDEEDGELNLARILVPPKRQQSIRSLRKHLADNPEPSRRALSGRIYGSVSSNYGNWDESESQSRWGWVTRREPMRRGSLEEDENPSLYSGFLTAEGSTRSIASSKNRVGLPSGWS
ncbi:uncharacterized protein BT62DRAFT_63788 [Guyanagaster necrorhizus]|uniref:Uncharacterized protein n=1 Tax=Guyanagaster necrorhizus TaxID=856835 RepID=A0A9P7VTE4_9AGAR|nr:uncharacterized protein BT62DRAFT_63788 [Guyanagaster necrorhizus MCA 3950]KAG7447151.1 hypothetical protein BT62DRAFT_63788 [Guyanagaster necrorhizus MCA 3950]